MTERRTRLLEDRGATAVEYALMLALIAMVIFGAVMFLGSQTDGQFEKVETASRRPPARTAPRGRSGIG